MSSFGWGTSFFYHPTPKYNLWNHFRPFIIDFDLELILIFESENRLVNTQSAHLGTVGALLLNSTTSRAGGSRPDRHCHWLLISWSALANISMIR